jgi:putative membrane protein
MFIDYVAMMLINLVAALSLVAIYLVFGIDKPDQRRWAPGFGLAGLVFFVAGFHMLFNWPLPSSYNVAFGSGAVLFGTVLFGAAVAQAFGWDLFSIAIYASFAGLASLELGIRMLTLQMTQSPGLSGAGFILAGLTGILGLPAWWLRRQLWLRVLLSIIPTAAAVIFAIIGYGAFWEHLSDFASYSPPAP